MNKPDLLKEEFKEQAEFITHSLKNENECTKMWEHLDEFLKFQKIDTFDEILR